MEKYSTKLVLTFQKFTEEFPIELKGKIPGTKKTTKFWASGISIVYAHEKSTCSSNAF